MENKLAASELILNENGSIYHLHLHPEQVAETIITVGDPGRVDKVSSYFDRVEHRVAYREFVTHTGYLNNKRLTVISTGIGTDNIDIVINELDALFNIDFSQKKIKPALTSLQFFRLGTSGSMQADIDVDSWLISEMAIGLDGLMGFYKMTNSIEETVYLEAFKRHLSPHFNFIQPYIASADSTMLSLFEKDFVKGTTLTATGFYAPQGRCLRTQNEFPHLIEVMNNFRHTHFRLTNLEMETAAIYALGNSLGHRSVSLNAIMANRISGKFSSTPEKTVAKMIERALEIITT